MLIDIRDRRRQYIVQSVLVRMMISIERKYILKLEPIIMKQYRKVASRVRLGRRNTVNGIIDTYKQELIFFLRSLYKVSANTFFDFAINDVTSSKGVFPLEKKDLIDVFWRVMNRFISTQSLKKTTTINTTTKIMVGRIIKKGIDEGITNTEISKNIIKKGLIDKKWRADRIVRTETHTVSVKSIREAVKSTGIVKDKQWVHAGDARVRTKNFNHRISERVPIDDYYVGTGEQLMYPGDPVGSGGNVIHCRCIEMYMTK